MTHSDNRGLILPSKIAPFQVVIMTLFSDKEPKILETAKDLKSSLNCVLKIDSTNKNIGFKAKNWEVKGVPIRIEIGPKDIESGFVLISVRNGTQKVKYKLGDVTNELISKLLSEHDKTILDNAKKIRDEKHVQITSVDQIRNVVDAGNYGSAFWTEDLELEKKIKNETGATIRCLVESPTEGLSINSKKNTTLMAVFARSY